MISPFELLLSIRPELAQAVMRGGMELRTRLLLEKVKASRPQSVNSSAADKPDGQVNHTFAMTRYSFRSRYPYVVPWIRRPRNDATGASGRRACSTNDSWARPLPTCGTRAGLAAGLGRSVEPVAGATWGVSDAISEESTSRPPVPPRTSTCLLPRLRVFDAKTQIVRRLSQIRCPLRGTCSLGLHTTTTAPNPLPAHMLRALAGYQLDLEWAGYRAGAESETSLQVLWAGAPAALFWLASVTRRRRRREFVVRCHDEIDNRTTSCA